MKHSSIVVDTRNAIKQITQGREKIFKRLTTGGFPDVRRFFKMQIGRSVDIYSTLESQIDGTNGRRP